MMTTLTEWERDREKFKAEFFQKIVLAMAARPENLTPTQIFNQASELWAMIERSIEGTTMPTQREKILLDALRFYADRATWLPGDGAASKFANDLGTVARTAIQMAGF